MSHFVVRAVARFRAVPTVTAEGAWGNLHYRGSPMRTLLIFLVAAHAAAAQKNGCANSSLQWTINPTYSDNTPTAIRGDQAPYTYIDGQAGVTAHINTCATNATNDATLQLGKPRTLSFSFATMLAHNANTPSWALSGSTVSGAGFLNIRNILFNNAGNENTEYTFTTTLGSNPPASGSPAFPMVNPNSQTTTTSGLSNILEIAETPYVDSLVIVHHCPVSNVATATCPAVAHETWFAYADRSTVIDGGTGQTVTLPATGTLLVTSRGSQVNGGQFSMPFSFVISKM